jgi:hypothetical protein
MSIPAAMYPLLMTGATASLQTSFVGTPTITTFSNNLLGVTGPTSIFGHLNLPVYDSVALWLDAADFATIGLSATRGAGGFSQVSAWYDKSSNAQHLFQATAANQPYYHPSGFNGRPGVRFGYNSAATPLARTGPFISGTGQITMFLVYRFEGLNNQRIISAVGTGNTDGAADAFGFKNDVIGIQYTRGGAGSSTPAGRNNYQYMCLSFLQNPSSNTVGGIGPSNIAYFLNGVASTTFQSSSFTSNFNASNFTLFNGSPGFVAELIIYRRTLLTPERQSMESYLINKWRIATATIPVPAQQGFGANLALWLDAADNDMLTFSNNGQNVVPTVSVWFDKSGNSQHTRQTTLARQPYYEATGFNGLPGLRFGYNSTAFPIAISAQSLGTTVGAGFIGGNSPAIGASPNFTMFFVLKTEGQAVRFIQTTGVSGASSGFGAGNFDSFAVSLGCLNSVPFAQVQGVRYGGAPIYTGSTELSFREVLITSMANATSVAAGGLSSNTVGFFLNGALVASNINPTNILSNLNCRDLVIGQTSHGNGGTWQGYFAEFIVYNTVLSVTQRQAVETYLINKWNLGTTTVPVPSRFGNRAPLRHLGPCLWLDANDTATVLRSTGPNAGMGNAYVQTWFDKSGREFYVTQANAANRPYYDATGFNGKPTIRFGATGATGLNTVTNVFFGSSNFLGTGDILNEMTMFAVMRMDVDLQTTGRMLSALGIIGGGDTSSDGFAFFYQQPTNYFGSIKYFGSLPLNLGSNFLLSFVANSNTSNIGGIAANSFQYFINGVPSASGALTGNAASNFSTLALGIGASAALGSAARFALSELIIYGRSLLGSERSNVESYLTSKWAITSASQAAPFQVGTTAQPLYRTLGLWYDAADVATVGLDATGYVQNFYDKSGYGHTLSQNNALIRPYYNPVGYNSLPAIQTSAAINNRDGTNLQTAGNAVTILNGKNAMTFFIVMRHEGSVRASNRVLSLFSTNTVNDNAAPNFTIRHNGTTFSGEGVIGAGTGTLGFGSNFLLTLLMNNQSNNFGDLGINSNTPVWYVNGAINSIGGQRNPIATIGPGAFYLGSGQGGAAINGTIAEFLLYTSTLTFADKNNIENYLMTKWSVSSIVTTRPAPNVFFSSLSTWLDTNDTGLIRTTGGSNITTIGDKSLNGRSSATSTYRVFPGVTAPTYISTIWTTSNNIRRSVASFNAANRNMLTGQVPQLFSGDMLSNRNMSLFTVGQIDARSQIAGRIYSLADSNRAYGTATTTDFSAANIGGFAMYTSGANGISVQRNFPNSNNLLTATTGCNIKFQTTLLINGTGTTFGGTSVGPSNSLYSVFTASGPSGVTNVFSNITTSFATSTITSFISTFALGGSALVGAANPTTDMFHGLLGEVVAYARCVTDIERAAIEQYLQSKWF